MRVLYASDGKAPARHAGRVITGLFDPSRVQVDVLTVIPKPPPLEWIPDDGYDEAHLDIPPLADGEEIARAAAETVGAAGFESTYRSSTGTPAEEILRRCDESAYGLVVLGGSHTTWMGNTLLGSTSMYVLHHARTSVLVAHRAPSGSGKVVVAVDGSEASASGAEIAMRIMDREKSSIDVVTVVPNTVPALVPPYFGGYAMTSGDGERLERERIARGRRLAQNVSARMAAAGFYVDDVVLVGPPGPQLLKEIDNVDADLILVGARGTGALWRTLLGSVSDQMVRHAPATLVARPENN